VVPIVSLTCTISKNYSFILPSLSTNLKTITICSFLDSSRASSTIMQNLESPIRKCARFLSEYDEKYT